MLPLWIPNVEREVTMMCGVVTVPVPAVEVGVAVAVTGDDDGALAAIAVDCPARMPIAVRATIARLRTDLMMFRLFVWPGNGPSCCISSQPRSARE
jgi:hypothetical protein